MQKINYQHDVLERFIPVSINELVDDLCKTDYLSEEQQNQFRIFCNRYQALFHARSYQQLLALKQRYLVFSPDRDTLITREYSAKQYAEQFTGLDKNIKDILNKANFELLAEEHLTDAFNKISPYGVKVSVNIHEFEEFALYYRGAATQTEYRRYWQSLFLKKKKIDVKIYRRLFILLKPKSLAQRIADLMQLKKISHAKAEKLAAKEMGLLGRATEGHNVYIKLFKNIPYSDLEMLFPNTRVEIRMFDKINLGVTGGGGPAGGAMAVLNKLTAVIDPIAAVTTIVGFIGVLWRQITKIFVQRTKYMAALTKNLYFYNLDNNMGALTYVFDLAEDEECKEALLAYFFLLSDGAQSSHSLDQKIEAFIKRQYGIPMDFEVSDGINKLYQSSLLIHQNELLQALPLQQALNLLREQWEELA